ncbi:fatty acid CoA ligase family protein [Anderseniella sp. Alg231-50]|uniref:fatty acid CoA ligase family protein n=1 Tax=Anderseniella sp. Alg231-50 TaxID=1922226 RepID=UPI000D559474
MSETSVQDRSRPAGGLSHVRGSGTPALDHITIPEFLNGTVKRYAGQEAVVFCEPGMRWTWQELQEQVDRFAAGLLSLGLYKGDRIGIWSPNRPEWVIAQFATARIGLILVNINPAYRRHELEFALNKVGAKALISATSFKSSDYIEMLQDLAPELSGAVAGDLKASRLPKLTTIIHLGDEPVAGMYRFADVSTMGDGANRTRLDAITESLKPDDAINIQFTSGTTGTPKGATLTHANVVNNARYCAMAMRLNQEDRIAIPVPLYHCFGMVLGNLAAVSTGTVMVFPGEAFDPLQTLTALADESCTAVHGVPTMFAAMLDHERFEEFRLGSLRTGIMAGSPCPISLMKRVVSQMNASEITIAYGMTETSPVSFQSDTGDSLDRRVSTVGRIHPHVEVKIINEAGDTVTVGEQGELLTRGYCVMKGYWGDPETTAHAIDKDGWMHTGDLAVLDADGYCNIVGRVKDMLIRGGENVYPREIEEFLMSHPSIQQAQVFGVPDQKYGEEVCAWIVLKPGEVLSEDDVRSFCQGEIAHYKIPRYMRFVGEFPMTVTGKPQKFVMRDKMIEELGLKVDKTA